MQAVTPRVGAARIIEGIEEPGKGGTAAGTASTTRDPHQPDGRTNKRNEDKCVKDNMCMPLSYSIPFIKQYVHRRQ